MSIKLQLASIDANRSEDVKLQYIPARIEEAHGIDIDNKFNNYTKEVDGYLSNELRGFPLNGCKFTVPETHEGVIFQETQRPLDETTDRTFKVKGVFNEFTYWNYDKIPSHDDKLKQALQWNKFADALHEPISAEEFEAAMADTKEN